MVSNLEARLQFYPAPPDTFRVYAYVPQGSAIARDALMDAQKLMDATYSHTP